MGEEPIWMQRRKARPTDPGWASTIVPTRYGGSYEGGLWACFPCEFYSVPQEAIGDDGDAMCFWESDAARFVGRGNSPKTALDDMERRWAGSGQVAK